MKKHKKIDGEPRVLTVGEVAKYLRVHQTTIYRLLKTQKLFKKKEPIIKVSQMHKNLQA